VIYAQGDIVYGKGSEELIGQELIINALRKARKSSSVKAIVLRVDSPGGSALASELIWREIELTKAEIPVVVSMGNLAASGGYYIACNADRIFASPTTITGSIGVFGVIPNIEKFADRIGINAEQVRTNKGAYYSIFEPMSDKFRNVTKEGVEKVYTTFLERVSKGRSMSVEAVHEVAQGRVWSGTEALEKGLVDELGTLEDAVEYAAELVGIESYRIRNYPSYKIEFEDRFKAFPFAKSSSQILEEELGAENYKWFKQIKTVGSMRGVQARIPFLMELK
jgi:protease-4